MNRNRLPFFFAGLVDVYSIIDSRKIGTVLMNGPFLPFKPFQEPVLYVRTELDEHSNLCSVIPKKI